MKQSFKIRKQAVGTDEPCFVIAEAGSNHNCDLQTALALIDVAAEAKADAVKFQTFKASRLYTRQAGQSDYLGDARSIYDIIELMEMPETWLPTLRDYAHAKGLAFISTPFHEEAVSLLNPFVDAFKIASYEMTHHPLLKEVAACGKPVIMSTGAANEDEVEAALQVLKEAGCEELVLLQCTAAYPAPLESINILTIKTMRERFGVPAGLSDHSRSPTVAPMTAAALQAAVIEKHYTLSNKLPGPDHGFAVEPSELNHLVASVRDVEKVLGTGQKMVHGVEEELRHFARRSLFTTCDVKAGEQFSRANVDVLRRGTQAVGLDPAELEWVLATCAARDLKADQPLTREDVRG